VTNKKSYMGFRLTPRSMTLDDLELNKFEFSEFRGISQISDAITVKQTKIGQYCQRQHCKHIELEQFWQAFASRGFVSDSWAFLYNILSTSGGEGWGLPFRNPSHRPSAILHPGSATGSSSRARITHL